MANLLLSLTLVVTQLFSCGAVPLYLCACDSGSVCIDTGPDDCDCCHDPAAATASSSRDRDHDDDDHGFASGRDSCPTRFESAAALGLLCDCQHVALSAWGGPAIARTTEAPGTSKFIVAPAPVSSTSSTQAVGLSVIRAEFCGPSPPTFFASAILGCVVLRC